MEATLSVPDAQLVREACERFDRENEVSEKALAELFAAYPTNDDASHVLLKVVALNSLYSTRILAVLKLAMLIAGQGAKIDAALAAGSTDAVEAIAGGGQTDLTFYSFATKYCNWHKPDSYPIYDSRVDKYLWSLKKQGLLHAEKLVERGDMWSYSSFREVMAAFREEFGLGAFSFKEIDKFVWSQSEAIWAVAEEAREETVTPEAQEPEPEFMAAGDEPAESAPVAVESPVLEEVGVGAAVGVQEEIYRVSEHATGASNTLFLDTIPHVGADPIDDLP
ncbi:MAG TPA: hypothetical protein VF730_08350 [Terracidiphilus sp.]